MTDLFDAFLPALLAREGGATYTNRSADRGGPTKYGVTAAKLGDYRKLGRAATPAEVQGLSEVEAKAIYRSDYWSGPGFDIVATVSARIAEEMLDTGVNMGPAWPAKWLQDALNLCNRRGMDWPDIAVDGQLGPATLSSLRKLLALRGQRAGEDLVLKCLNGLQFDRYLAIVRASGTNGDQEENWVGWLAQRIGVIA